MRWPFGPPHLTLKPSKKTKKQKTKKNQKQKKQKKKTKEREKNPKTQKWQKKSFSVISQIFPFFWWVSKISFFDNLAKKRAPQKHYKNRGFSNPFSGNQFWVTKRPFLDQKNPNPEIPVIIFLLPFSSLTTTKNTKISWNPYFYSVLADLKKRIFKI